MARNASIDSFFTRLFYIIDISLAVQIKPTQKNGK